MFLERIDSPVGGIGEVAVRGRFACVVECGLSATWQQGTVRGEPVIGGQILDLESLGDSSAQSFLRIRGESSNALGLQHQFAVISGDSLEELRSVQPKPFTPMTEVVGTSTAAGALFDIGDHVQILTPGRLSYWCKNTLAIAGAGSVLYVNGSDQLPAVGPAYFDEGLNEADAYGIRLDAKSTFVQITSQSFVNPGLFRLSAYAINAGDVYVCQLGTV